MEIFEKFTETIFLKEENSLEEQLNKLRTRRDKVVEKKKYSSFGES